MTTLRKYPRTYHFPWSLGATDDDKVHHDVSGMFSGKRVIMTEKCDGENTTIYSDGYCHARSLDSANHPSRNWVKSMIAPMMVGNLPHGWRVCGENMYALHSISYTSLPSYFLVFAIYDENNQCLSWDETVEWCTLLGLHHVKVIMDGVWDEEAVKAAWKGQSSYGDMGEGYVVRTAEGYPYDDFASHVAKYVRKNHVNTDVHWKSKEIVPNGLQNPE